MLACWTEISFFYRLHSKCMYMTMLNTSCGVAPPFPGFLDSFGRGGGSVPIFLIASFLSCFVLTIGYTCAIQFLYYISQPFIPRSSSSRSDPTSIWRSLPFQSPHACPILAKFHSLFAACVNFWYSSFCSIFFLFFL